MEAHAIEIGRSEEPTDIVTTRVRSAEGSLGLTCPRVSGPSLAAQLLMTELAARRRDPRDDEVRRYRPWPVQAERYRVVIKPNGNETALVAVKAEDGREVDEVAPARHTYHTAAQLMQRLRQDAGDPAGDDDAIWREVQKAALARVASPPRLDEPQPGAELRGGGWPEDEEFPLDPDECVALVRGLGVVPRRPFSLDQLYQLPGAWEMVGGRISFRRR